MKKSLAAIMLIFLITTAVFLHFNSDANNNHIELNFNYAGKRTPVIGSATLPNILLETQIGDSPLLIKLTLTEALVEGERSNCKAALRIYRGEDEVLIQEIDLSENGIPTTLWGNIYTADVNFDGFNDIILNREYNSENDAVFNYCWLWNNEREEFVETPEFAEFANTFLDNEHQLLQSYYRDSSSEYYRAAYSHKNGKWIPEYLLTKSLNDENIIKYSEEIRNTSNQMVLKEYFIPVKVEQHFDEIYNKLITAEIWNVPEDKQLHFREN